MLLILVNLITCIVSMLMYAVTFEIFGVLASGATLIRAISLSRSSQKVKQMAEDPKVKTRAQYFWSLVILFFATFFGKVLKVMKALFAKLGTTLKNNPVTLLTALVEAALCSGLYPWVAAVLFSVERCGEQWSRIWSIVFVAGVYLLVAALTIYLGHDSEAFASIRKLVKKIGGGKAVATLDEVAAVLRAQEDAERAEAEARKAREAEDALILAQIEQEEAAKAEAAKAAKIAAWRAAHPNG